jgi:hypothetical protein
MFWGIYASMQSNKLYEQTSEYNFIAQDVDYLFLVIGEFQFFLIE